MKYLLTLTLIVLLSSCVSSKKMVYFQETEGSAVVDSIISYEPSIVAGDELTINVSALDPEAAVPFNLVESSGVGASKPISYLVNSDGLIHFPVIGNIKAGGLTTKVLTATLVKKLTEYLKKPIVNIRLTNFKVTVLGDVTKPGTFNVTNERITILEALGLAGDLTIQGKRKSVLLIREQAGKRVFIPIDLTSKQLFNSPYYYMAQNDVLYVEPNFKKINTSAISSNVGLILSSVSTIISIIVILTK